MSPAPPTTLLFVFLRGACCGFVSHLGGREGKDRRWNLAGAISGSVLYLILHLGKSMLALYERIELMEEDSIPLTRANAVRLIEEAADRAEKPPIGKRLKGMFSSKYDKNGLLILKEEDFIY